ncbi:hypothetical protein IAQ61_001231 [Plenodomus lingam]|uniref:uncharacterized protein n=1 Tax=Leptosphaeria maculans TaxID=5022 RepID=UPI0033193EF3|nr:hypothetical protein IAQ61_001231 [Plenodomus lingam]
MHNDFEDMDISRAKSRSEGVDWMRNSSPFCKIWLRLGPVLGLDEGGSLPSKDLRWPDSQRDSFSHSAVLFSFANSQMIFFTPVLSRRGRSIATVATLASGLGSSERIARWEIKKRLEK